MNIPMPGEGEHHLVQMTLGFWGKTAEEAQEKARAAKNAAGFTGPVDIDISEFDPSSKQTMVVPLLPRGQYPDYPLTFDQMAEDLRTDTP